jgi:hypothetical protein
MIKGEDGDWTWELTKIWKIIVLAAGDFLGTR